MPNPVIKGKVVEGIKESGSFTSLTWVREQFIAKLGIDPYPGTLNLEVAGADLEKLVEIRKWKGIEIVPAPGFCSAKCLHVLVGGKIKGALVVPLVSGYPEAKMEIIASEKVTDALVLKVGDLVEVRILQAN